MRFGIGGTLAKCLACGSNDFAPLRRTPMERSDRLACIHCCSEMVYEDLVSQIIENPSREISPPGPTHLHKLLNYR